jgi:glycine cleavage system T protein (aminomethyltransferase)
MTLLHSPLDARHRALGARMVEFGGWEMPIQYPGGVLEEHRACREGGVVFDVSHLGTVECAGPGTFDALQWAFTNDLHRIEPGKAQYTHLLDPADASVVDDIIVWWVEPERVFVMPNASNTTRVFDALREAGEHADREFEFSDITRQRAVIAVQGPQAKARARAVLPEVADVARNTVHHVTWDGVPLVVAGTGYTGEDGVEVHVGAADAPALWDVLVAAGLTPAGLGARDTLRLEAGLPLHGHELGPGITPLQAGLAWVVRFDKGDFRGRAALERERDTGPARVLRGLTVEGRQPPRAGASVMADGAVVGEVTSGNFSPTLGHGIALAFVPPSIEPGDDVVIDLRGRQLPAHVVKPPFVAKSR